MPANCTPKIRVLTRRSPMARSLIDLTQPREPLLEIADVFRVDIIADAFEMPDFEGHVRFVFNQGENWAPPTPVLDYDSDDDIPLRRAPLIDFDKLFCDAWWMILFADVLPERHLEDLLGTNQWQVWWCFHGVAGGYQSLFTRAGILELRERYRSLPKIQQDLILDAFNFYADEREYFLFLQMLPWADDWHSTVEFLHDNRPDRP